MGKTYSRSSRKTPWECYTPEVGSVKKDPTKDLPAGFITTDGINTKSIVAGSDGSPADLVFFRRLGLSNTAETELVRKYFTLGNIGKQIIALMRYDYSLSMNWGWGDLPPEEMKLKEHDIIKEMTNRMAVMKSLKIGDDNYKEDTNFWFSMVTLLSFVFGTVDVFDISLRYPDLIYVVLERNVFTEQRDIGLPEDKRVAVVETARVLSQAVVDTWNTSDEIKNFYQLCQLLFNETENAGCDDVTKDSPDVTQLKCYFRYMFQQVQGRMQDFNEIQEAYKPPSTSGDKTVAARFKSLQGQYIKLIDDIESIRNNILNLMRLARVAVITKFVENVRGTTPEKRKEMLVKAIDSNAFTVESSSDRKDVPLDENQKRTLKRLLLVDGDSTESGHSILDLAFADFNLVRITNSAYLSSELTPEKRAFGQLLRCEGADGTKGDAEFGYISTLTGDVIPVINRCTTPPSGKQQKNPCPITRLHKVTRETPDDPTAKTYLSKRVADRTWLRKIPQTGSTSNIEWISMEKEDIQNYNVGRAEYTKLIERTRQDYERAKSEEDIRKIQEDLNVKEKQLEEREDRLKAKENIVGVQQKVASKKELTSEEINLVCAYAFGQINRIVDEFEALVKIINPVFKALKHEGTDKSITFGSYYEPGTQQSTTFQSIVTTLVGWYRFLSEMGPAETTKPEPVEPVTQGRELVEGEKSLPEESKISGCSYRAGQGRPEEYCRQFMRVNNLYYKVLTEYSRIKPVIDVTSKIATSLKQDKKTFELPESDWGETPKDQFTQWLKTLNREIGDMGSATSDAITVLKSLKATDIDKITTKLDGSLEAFEPTHEIYEGIALEKLNCLFEEKTTETTLTGSAISAPEKIKIGGKEYTVSLYGEV